ncbi:MAG: TolC family protein, partial [Sandarakinorhabdus sp.]|nr:TolC family protein [Sandarakinorhabdus sp.]
MVTRLNDVRRVRPAGVFGALLLAGGALAVASPAAAQLLLPPPEQNPQSIDFTADPLLLFLSGQADPAPFRAAIADAVARHPATGEAEAGSDIAREIRRETRSALFPSLNAGLVGAHSLARDFQGNSTIVEGLVPRGRTDATVGANQLLADFGVISGRIGGASARLRRAPADAGRAAIATTYAAIEAWYQLLGYQSALDLDEALIQRHRRIVADTRTRVAAGLGAGGDIARAEAGLADAIVASARTERQLAAVRARYREAFGTEAPARPQRPARPQSAAADPATARAMAHASPPVVAALAAAEAARSDSRAARGDMLPRLTAGVDATMFNVLENGRNYDVRGALALRQAFSVGGAES